MHELRFATNPNGKLFLQYFSTVQPEDPEVFFLGAKFEVYLKSAHLGSATIAAIRGLQYRFISDVLAYIENGTPAHVYGKQLAIVHGTSGRLEPTAELVHMVLQYTWINCETMSSALNQYWNELSAGFYPQENQNAI